MGRCVFVPGGPPESPGSPQIAQGRQTVHSAYALDPELLASTFFCELVVVLPAWSCLQLDFPTLPPFPPSLSSIVLLGNALAQLLLARKPADHPTPTPWSSTLPLDLPTCLPTRSI